MDAALRELVDLHWEQKEGKASWCYECGNVWPCFVRQLADVIDQQAHQIEMFAPTSLHPTVCSACGQQYMPNRLPRNGQRHYCPDCGYRVARRDASRAY